jgi:hypothetical protein
MVRIFSRRLFVSLALAALMMVFGTVGVFAQASVTVYALTTDDRVITFMASDPGTLTNQASISGVAEGDRLIGIDVRPATGQLFALGSAGTLYVLNPATGSATRVGSSTFNPALNGSAFGFDFNPTVDRIRLTSNAGQNLRLNPNNGAVAATDGALGYASGDRNAGSAPGIVASAYTNNFGGAGSTTLYNIDATNDVLVSQIPPNNGTLNTIGALGINATNDTSFDIMSDRLGSDAGYLSLGSSFYTINLANGSASFVGTIGGGVAVRAIAVTGSVGVAISVPMCSDFDGSASPVVRVGFAVGEQAFCRVLFENRQSMSALAGAQIGSQDVLNRGVIQAVDVFRADGGQPLSGIAQVCLLGTGSLIFLDATQSPRVPAQLDSMMMDGYTCAFIANTGTAVLVAR